MNKQLELIIRTAEDLQQDYLDLVAHDHLNHAHLMTAHMAQLDGLKAHLISIKVYGDEPLNPSDYDYTMDRLQGIWKFIMNHACGE